jgi:alpha-beta hydrolase superfamily lysophospholipase
MKNLRRIIVYAAVVASVWLAVCAVAGIVAAEMALHPGRSVEGTKSQELAAAIAKSHQATLTDASVMARDDAILRGWSMRPVHGNGDAVILLHGHTDNRAGMLGYADLMLRHGYSVVLVDARAHGVSGGDLATYGVLEADDVRRWYDWIAQAESPRCIFGLGESMGAAQLLNSLGADSEGKGREICAVVAESPFASFREASYDRLAEKLHAGAWLGRTLLRPAVDAGFLYARWKYGVDLERASPEDAVAESSVPVLLIHGLKDTNLPPRHSEMILARSDARGAAVALWEPEGAGHTGAASAKPEEFERRVIGWFESHDHH